MSSNAHPMSRHRSPWRKFGLGRSRIATRLVPAVAGIAIVAVTAACGGNGGGSSPASNHPVSVKIGKAVDTIGFTSADVAEAKGYFAKGGIKATNEVLGGSSTAFAALQSGGVQFVLASSTALMKAKAKGVPLQAIAALDHGVSVQLLVETKWAKAHNLSPNQPLSTAMKGMVGAKLGEISSTDEAFYHYLMHAANVDPSKFSYVHIKGDPAALAAIQHGAIDAFLVSPPSTYFAQSQGNGKIIVTLHEVPLLANMAYDVVVVDTRYAKSHPDVVKAVATGFAKADNVMLKNPQSIIDVEKKHYRQMNSTVLLQSLHYVTFTENGTMTAARWKNAKQVAENTGEKVSSLDVSSPGGGVWTNKYIDTSALS